MGNKHSTEQVELVSTHPNFKVAKVITENEYRYIKAIIPTDDESYTAWKKLLIRDANLLEKSEFLLLPKNYILNKEGMCSHSGNVEVFLSNHQGRL